MDKETLSNYGWIVICVLVLAVMLALATPFGSFVSGAVQSTTQGLFDVNSNALEAVGITIDDNEFAIPKNDTVYVTNLSEMKDALNDVKDGDNLKIVLSDNINTTGADIELANFNYSSTAQAVFNIKAGNVTLDFNGKTINVDTTGGSNVFSVFMVTGNANFTVTGSGTMNYNTYGRSGGCAAFTTYGANSVLNLNGNVETTTVGTGSSIQMIYAHGSTADLGKIYVNAGTYNQKTTSSFTNLFYAQGGGNSNIIVSGGTFKVYSNYSADKMTAFDKYITIADGYTYEASAMDADGFVTYTIIKE